MINKKILPAEDIAMSGQIRLALGSVALIMFITVGCGVDQHDSDFNPETILPKEIIDLSPVITENLTEQIWGKAALQMLGFRGTTNFVHVGIDTPTYVRNSYIELFNHGGAHLDAPNHMDKDGMSIEGWDLKKLIGPVKILDATSYKENQPIPVEPLIELNLSSRDIFILHVAYTPPGDDKDLPSYPFLSSEAVEYLASIPVKAVATDAFSIESFTGFAERVEVGFTGYESLIPNHHAILTNGIPLFEALENVSELLDKEDVIFLGFPLKIKNGNASPVRAVAFVY
ncbi:hypothetical protein G3570_12070 [Balneolaceae bacterium YR4-1]|uniref:Cyclase family protein n=1 Tax=Halalkalibaculum roseum TaxID=2709311 RepID=A0A6M1T5W6_9BACT|nr:cyclase family protein [Halalkalibaculum roseum]NGP77375.1 hypothetical protein [Halalkalibaculum roseum]